MDTSGLQFVDAVVDAGGSPQLARDTEMVISFLADMTRDGKVSMIDGLHLSIMFASWIVARAREAS